MKRDAPTTREPEVFICYASQDRDRVLPIAEALEAAGVQVWVDRHKIGGGSNYGPEIVRAIKGCKVLIVMCSTASMASRNVRQEIQLAWKYEQCYLPLLLEPVSFPEQVEYWLEGRQWVEVLDRAPAQWLPAVLQALSQAGVQCDDAGTEDSPGVQAVAETLCLEDPGAASPAEALLQPPSRWGKPGGSPEDLPAFIAGPPITHPRLFFGRERELKRLYALWRRLPLQNAAIIGPRRSGKTSLLRYLSCITTTPPAQLRPGQRVDWLPAPERYQWILVDFQDPRMGTREGLIRFLLAHMALPAPAVCDLDHFLDLASGHLRTPTLILFDEIGVALQRYAELDDPFWEGLRSLATNQVAGNLGFVLASHEPPDQLACHGQLGSPFFNIFGYSAVLGPLVEAEAQELVASSPIPFPPADAEWILTQSGRWPMLLQLLCRERLLALEMGEDDDNWKAEGLRQLAPFRSLLEEP